MTIKVEKGVKIPPRKGAAPTEFTKALSTMKVLDSIFVKEPKHASQAMHSWIAYHKRPERFVTRKMNGGTRIWRVK